MNKIYITYCNKNVYGTNLEYIHPADAGTEEIIRNLTNRNKTISPQIRQLLTDLTLGGIQWIEVKENDSIEYVIKLKANKAINPNNKDTTSEEASNKIIDTLDMLLNHPQFITKIITNDAFNKHITSTINSLLDEPDTTTILIDHIIQRIKCI